MTERRQRRRIRDRARIQSSLSIVPSLFTVGNIFCGYYSAISTLRGNYDNAAIAIGVGIVLDALDGRIARLTKTSSDFGEPRNRRMRVRSDILWVCPFRWVPQ